MTNQLGRRQSAGEGGDTLTAEGIIGNGSKGVGATADSVRSSERESHAANNPARRHHRVNAHVRLVMLAVLIVAVGAGAGFIGALLLPKEYAARAELKYSLSESMPNALLREDRQLITQQVLLEGRGVLAPVAFDNGMRPEDLAENVSAKVVDNSEIIEVEVRDRTRERAHMLLTAVVARYLIVANSNWQDPVRSYVESELGPVRSYLEFQLGEVQKQLQLATLPPENAAELTRRADTLRGLLGPLQLKPVGPDSPSAPPAEVLTEPYPVAEQAFPKPRFAAAAGGAAALVVAAFVVLLVARNRLRS
ncbi:hypothetical protein [Mycobacterium sp.]|uniref:hypothetical protein n=1 Tax=Mycobacterium sp. TaxID=1785 RepID=UPI002DAC94E0|nr:hypothetical protein [Mycobacterium sp.]